MAAMRALAALSCLLPQCFCGDAIATFGQGAASVKAGVDAAKSHEAWSSTLEAEFERLRTTLPTLDYEAANALLH